MWLAGLKIQGDLRPPISLKTKITQPINHLEVLVYAPQVTALTYDDLGLG